MAAEVTGRYVKVEGIRLHYLEGGTGDPVLLLHGWPTSSYLWRNIAPKIAEKNRVIALDLPGFGLSDKPLDASYSFRFYTRVLDAFLRELEIDATSLVVHDLGGPIGLYWACQNPGRIQKLALLNTLVYPRLSWAVVLFVAICRTPGLGALVSSAGGLRWAMRFGVHDPGRLSEETIRAYQAPFQTRASRRALLKAGYGLHPDGMKDIARGLPALTVPVRIIYGTRDRILPDVAKTMAHVARDLPQARVTALRDCGHFLQEDAPEKIADLLAEFLGE
ncbi:MAG: alpha/beta fold hydrolase [Myxococcota bacterium]